MAQMTQNTSFGPILLIVASCKSIRSSVNYSTCRYELVKKKRKEGKKKHLLMAQKM